LVVSLIALAAAGVVPVVAATAGAGPVTSADLALTKSDSPDPVTQDGTLTYSVQVKNNGPAAATNVVVSDDLSSHVDPGTATASQGSCDIQGKKVTCELGTLASGASATVTIQVSPKQDGQLVNEASVESDVADPQTANNQDTETTTVTAGGAASCKKKAATIVGTNAGETLTGTPKRDVILALGGDDQISGDAKGDLICAGDGNDFVRAGSDNDRVAGNAGKDKIKGQSGNDELKGNAGKDGLRGNAGDDLLAGGKSKDRCKGGKGDDTLRSC
jgi:uncharacterized repeat protein (TIGR01451 family)